MPMGGGLDHHQRVQAWVDYFDHPECDLFYFRRGALPAVNDDWIPPPEVVQAMLYNCRRRDCLPSAIRVLEQVRLRCSDNLNAYNWIMQELEPTIQDLGIKTPEELDFFSQTEQYHEPIWRDY